MGGKKDVPRRKIAVSVPHRKRGGRRTEEEEKAKRISL